MDWLNSFGVKSSSQQTPHKATKRRPTVVKLPGLKRLIANLGDSNHQVRCGAAQVLEQDADPVHLDRFLALVEDEHFEVRLAAIKYVCRLSDPAKAPALVARLAESDSDVRRAAAQALGPVRDPAALEPLVLSLTDEEPSVRHAAAASLEKIDPRWVRTEATKRAVPRLEALRKDPRPWIAAAAEKVLEKIRAAKDNGTEIWRRESGIRTL